MSRKGDNDRRSYDSGGHYGGQMFKVAVVGLSGTEKDKGCLGVGKSCLCNRFVRPQADQYNHDHISVLSQSDFSGPIVNNEHWLYWGETRKCTEEGFELTFSVVEQTEFVDDACFQPFRSGKMEPYYKRCSSTRLSSAEKLMYICKNQLGVEKEYDQHYLADGRFNVDGFVCVFDTSKIDGRPIERQVDFTAMVLSSLLKTKKPVVLVTTKNDESCEQYVREAEKLVARREFKGMIPLVETSAHNGVNVDLAFWACVQRDWTKGKTKIISYTEASQRQLDRLVTVNDAYMTLIRSQVTDYRTHWTNSCSTFSQSNDFQKYCDLFGQESAQQTFKRHVSKLKEDYDCRKMQMYLRVLPEIFNQLLPDLDSFGPDKNWPAVQQIIRNHALFENHFIDNAGLSWQDMDDNLNGPIPFDLLTTAEAEKVFVDHRDSLLAEEHLRSLRHQFSELLRETSIAPGQPLKEIRELLASRECVKTLPEMELSIIYEEYQKMLQERAREQLIELFLERPSLFLQYCSGNVVTQDDLVAISSKMEDDERWTALDLLPQDRSLDLYRHLGFIQWPIREHCPSYNACVDINTEAYCSTLAKRSPRHPLWNSEPEVIRIKLVVLGSSSLAENLATVVKAMRPTLEQENSRIYLDVRVSNNNEGIGILGSRLYPNPLEPEAYLCVYSSRSSLEYVRESLEQSLLTDLQFGNPHHASPPSIGLPLVLLLASNADTTAKERVFLREEGQNRSQSLQCAFFDVTSDETHARFKPEELLRALMFLIDSLIRRSDLLHVYSPAATSLNSLIPEGALNPEIRILVCMMCGDPISPAHFLELLLLPNSLPNTTFYPISKHSIVTDVGCLAALDEENENVDLDLSQVPSRYVEFVLTSYHGAYAYREELLHGYILVYWSKRQASFCNMSTLASTIGPIMPIQILTLVENESRPSKLSHQLVAEGQGLAQSLNAHFRVSTLSPDLGRCISSFLNYSLQNKLHIEKGLQMSPSAHSQIDGQSPVPGLPNESECYDPNSDQHFGSILPSHHQPHHHRQLSHDHDQAANLSDGIYEHLPDDERQHQQQQQQQQQQQAQPQFTSSLVRQPRCERKPLHSFSSNILDAIEPPIETVEDEQRHYFNQQQHPPFESENGAGEEHLVKPSQIKQRRHLNYYNNLQSYPSADSLDRVYSVDSPYSHYYNSDQPMLPHYVHRPFVHLQQRSFVGNSFVDPSSSSSSFDHHQHPPRPASSAHVMIPPHSHQPPPYSRVAVSPPPAYKIQQPLYGYGPSEPPHQFIHHYPPQEADFEYNSLALYQRRLYHPNQHHQFRSHSPPIDPYALSTHDPVPDHFDMDLIGAPIDSINSYRQSPLTSYATTGRNHHARSSHFHQLSHQQYLRPSHFDSFRPPLPQHQSFDAVSPYAVGRSTGHRHHKKKKKHHSSSKSRSSSAKAHRSASLVDDEANDEDDEPDDDDDDDEDDKSKLKFSSKLRYKDSKSLKKKKEKARYSGLSDEGVSSSNKEDIIDHRENSSRTPDQPKIDVVAKVVAKLEDKIALSLDVDGRGSKNRARDEEEFEDEGEGDIEPEDDEDDTVSSNLSAEEKRNVSADKCAVSSGWAFVQPNQSQINELNAMRVQLPEQWPPTQPTDDENSLNERFKAPGKIDLKRYNNLSNAIGRLNLNSPLGPTRANANSTFDSANIADNYNAEQLGVLANTLGQSNRRGRLRNKQLSSKEYDPESDNSDSNLTENMNQPLSTLAAAGGSTLSSNTSSFAKPLTAGLFATAGSQKKLQKKRGGSRGVPVPVAPPRLPSSANNSTAVTPTSSGPLKLFAGNGGGNSFDDSSGHNADSEFSTIGDDLSSVATLTFGTDNEDLKAIDLEQSQLTQRNRRPPMSKLFSLQGGDSESGIFFDTDTGTSTGLFAGSEDIANNNNHSNSNSNNNNEYFGKSSHLEKTLETSTSELDSPGTRKSQKQQKKLLKEQESNKKKNGTQKTLASFAQANGNPVPLFVVKCTQFIEKHLDTEGLYRIPGNKTTIDPFMQKFEENSEIDFDQLDEPVCTVATALKEFFMKRMPSIFPIHCLDEVIRVQKQYTDTRQLDGIRTFLHKLPNANYEIISFMFHHFTKIASHSDKNNMNSSNLSICWWPTLMQFDFPDYSTFEENRHYLIDLAKLLIDEYPQLFPNSNSNNNIAHNDYSSNKNTHSSRDNLTDSSSTTASTSH